MITSICAFSMDFSFNKRIIKESLRENLRNDEGNVISMFFFKFKDKMLIQLKLFKGRPFTVDSTLFYLETDDYIYLCAGESLEFCEEFNFNRWNDNLKCESLFSESKLKETPFPTGEIFFEFKDSVLYETFIGEEERNFLCDQLYMFKAVYQCPVLPHPAMEEYSTKKSKRCLKKN